MDLCNKYRLNICCTLRAFDLIFHNGFSHTHLISTRMHYTYTYTCPGTTRMHELVLNFPCGEMISEKEDFKISRHYDLIQAIAVLIWVEIRKQLLIGSPRGGH